MKNPTSRIPRMASPNMIAKISDADRCFCCPDCWEGKGEVLFVMIVVVGRVVVNVEVSVMW